MTGRNKFALWAIVLGGLGIMIATIVIQKSRIQRFSTILGTVIRDDADPHKQLPIPGVRIVSINGQTAPVEADNAGFFRLSLNPPLEDGDSLTLQFQHPQYEPLEITQSASDQLWITRMKPRNTPASTSPGRPITQIADVRIRHATKTMSTSNVGSIVRTLDVVNQGNMPCQKQHPCSPDGKWAAKIETFSLDAGENREFRNPRISCIAGPCTFTKIEAEELQNRGKNLKVSVRNWSDSTTFLIESEVFQTTMSDMVRRSYPVIFGSTMSFTLPPQAVGPSIEAEMDNSHIVFPLGPNLILSWAVCSLKTDQDQSRLYRCELKPGYQFKNSQGEL